MKARASRTISARGRGWACLRQFSVFMENRVGNLADLMRHIESVDLRVVPGRLVPHGDGQVVLLLHGYPYDIHS